MPINEYLRTNPRYPIFLGGGDRYRQTHPNRDSVEMAIRKIVYPVHEDLSSRVAKLVPSERIHRPSPWRNPHAYFAGLSVVDLHQHNSGLSEGRVWFTQDRDLGISVVRIHGIFPGETEAEAVFDKSKTPLIQTLSIATKGGNPDGETSIAEVLQEALGIKLVEPSVEFDVKNLALIVQNGGERLSYYFTERTNQLHGGIDQGSNRESSPEPTPTLKALDYIALIGTALKMSSFFRSRD